MKKGLSFLLCFISTFSIYSQPDTGKEEQRLLAEGKRLYRSEMASWYGADIFMAQAQDQGFIGGYFSYPDGDSTRCIFYSKGSTPRVIGTIVFDSTFRTTSATSDLLPREFTPLEKDLYTLRTLSGAIVNNDTLFKAYENTQLNLIPVIDGTERNVYILTGSQQTGFVIFGNDYLLRFDETDHLTEKKKLHHDMFITDYRKKGQKGAEQVGSMHTHLPETGEFITATDICTLMLYERFTKWKQYVVAGPAYLSIWDCEKDHLLIISREAMEKIRKDQNPLPLPR